MKRTLVAAAGFALFAASGLANAASWSVFVEPGVYGRVAIGGYAEPPMVYAPQPVIAVDNGYGQVVEEVVDPAYATDQPPVYLWVPEYQRLHWAQYCREYGAIGVPVYFVDDGWYRANVMRRNWTPEQRSWSQQQWLEQDRIARDRYERQRFEQQRFEQQQRWNAQREWYGQQQQGRWGHDHDRHGPPDGQNQIRWGSAQGYLPPQGNPGARPQPQPQPGGGQWQGNGQWQQPGTGGHAGNGGHAGGGYAGGSGGSTGGSGAYPGGYAGNGGYTGGHGTYGGNAGQQPPSASQPRGDGRGWQGGGQNAGERRGDDRGQDRGQRDERRAPPERHGGFEHGRSGGGRER
ncbi:MAG TPA: hypothetical protein VIN75_09465 [Burkholderiaceae bacterium]